MSWSESNAGPSWRMQHAPGLDLIRMRFDDPALEAGYRKSFVQHSLPIVRLSFLLGAGLVGAFAILDLFIVGDEIGAIYLLRFAVVCPCLLGLYLLTYTKLFRDAMQLLTMAAMMVVGLGVVAMTAVLEQPGSYLYYAGILDTVIYACCVMRLRFLYALLVSIVLFIAYQGAMFINPIPGNVLLSNNFFLATAVGVGAFAAYVQEYYLRVAYRNEHLLVEERDRSRELLTHARAASQAKSDFLAMVSHELRTPLNAVLGFSEMMSREVFGPLGDHRYTAYADDIHRSGSHLLDIINDILDLSKIEAGRLDLRRELTSVPSVVETVTRLMGEKIRQKNLSLMVEIPESIPMLHGDRSMLTRIVLNLLSNAVKFTEDGGEIAITAGLEDDGAFALAVRDSGIGIAEADLERVMEPFLQADSSLSRSHEGTGLGLPLSRKMAELHGGSLNLSSRMGVGTTAKLRLPAAVLAPRAASVAAE